MIPRSICTIPCLTRNDVRHVRSHPTSIVPVRRQRDVDWKRSTLTTSDSIVVLPGVPLQEIPTKNRRVRKIAPDALTLSMLEAQVEMMVERARAAGVGLLPDAYLFSDSFDGSEPWRPGTVTQYFCRLRDRAGLQHLDFHCLRKFMETYGQHLGFSAVQVALRAGHDPSIAARHYSGNAAEADRALADALASLLDVRGGSSVVRAPDS